MSQNYFASVTAGELGKALEDKLFRSTLELMQSGIQVLRTITDEPGDFEILFSNNAAQIFTGKGNKLSDTVPGKDSLSQHLLATIKKEAGEENTTRFYTHDHADAVFQCTATRLADGFLLISEQAVKPSSGMFEDSAKNISPKEQQLLLQDQSHLIQSIAKSTPDILFVMNLYDKEVVYINRSIEKILGYDPTRIAGMSQPFFDVIHPDDRAIVYDHLEEMKNAGMNETREIIYRMIDAAGEVHWFRDRNTVFKINDAGKAIEKTGVLHDISKDKKKEEKIHELNRELMVKNHELESVNFEIKTFNGIAANDYKDTLQNLYTNLEFILTKDAKNLSDSGKGNLRKMQAAIQKMKLLTDDIVSFSRLQTLDDVVADVDLNRILDIAKEDLAERIKETDARISADELPHIQGFPLLLSLLFFHLLDNAIKFRHEEHSPKVQVRYTKDVPPESIAASSGSAYHKISMIDGGKGFDEKNIDKLFTMFYRPDGKKYKGSGVGLAICRKIMDLHNGFITAESDGKGATFHCYFPV